jgi:hypothetical protein
MARRDEITALSTQSFSDYLATLGIFLTLCIAGMLTFVAVRVIEAYFPGTPQLAFWVLGVGIFVAAYFAYGQVKLAPLLAPVIFVVVFLLCREIASQPRAVRPHAQTSHSSGHAQ